MTELFGTNGVRGTINKDMDTDLALQLGKAIGTWIGKDKEVAIGTDTRASNYMLKNAVSSGLMATGCDVIDLGEVPTPALQFYTKGLADFGVAITASHNPPEFNGIKCVNDDGTELIGWMEEEIEDIYFSKDFDLVGWDEVGKKKSDDALDLYSAAIKEKIDEEAIRKAEPKVILDCANGAGCHLTPYLLRELGCEVVTLNAQPDGFFPGHNSEPIKENLQDLIRLTSETDADLGIAHDGDADRTIFIDEDGGYIHGDRTLTLVAEKLVKENKGGTVVTPVSSSSSVADVVEENGGELIYTAVGSPIVARRMIEENAIFGGEENGGLIFADHQFCRDGSMTAAKIVEMVAKEGKLSDMIEELPQYFLEKRGVECPDELKDPLLERLKEIYSETDHDDTDGLKIYYDEGWVLIRASGTEPKYRIYSEATDEIKAERLADEHQTKVEDILKSI
ncbi:MAG: phosphoglucosamine mutase [Candidatus Thermoplasmatota archaeon]|nr:phosphoglucosamine mutase [Candidatus Thermoplasmatota archaeon]MBS3789471.1 phosphoglucosamine mutase [Candidatus Thermoplasmatota archaeon]